MSQLPSLASFWHGGPLTDLELASLHSFRTQGHPVVVYSYEPIGNLPAEVEGRNAAELLPTREVALHRLSGSPSLHSNLVRYAMMRDTDHIWVDLDLIALRPLALRGSHVFGYESADSVNGAVLRLPKDSPALSRLLRLRADMRGVPPGLPWYRRARTWLRTGGRGRPIQDWPWGSAGPAAVTAALRRSGEIRHALPRETFYPVIWHDQMTLLEPGLGPDSFGPETLAVHLWANILRRNVAARFGGVVPADSFVGWAIDRARRDGFMSPGPDGGARAA